MMLPWKLDYNRVISYVLEQSKSRLRLFKSICDNIQLFVIFMIDIGIYFARAIMIFSFITMSTQKKSSRKVYSNVKIVNLKNPELLFCH